jgi:acetyl-CoA synthetase
VVEIGEAAVVPVPGPIKGRVPQMFVPLKPGYTASKELEEKISRILAKEIAPFAKSGRVSIVPDMPKTRSGKIMRRVLAAIADPRAPETS